MKRNITLTIVILMLCSCQSVYQGKDRSEITAPFDGKRFNNLEPFPDKSLWQVLKWRLFGDRADWQKVENQKFYKIEKKRSQKLRLTLIGHSTVLIQMNNLNILTDPQYSKRASFVSWAGPKRVIEPAIKFEDLPPIDIVLISHNHYDHLDLKTLKKLNTSFSPKFFVGLGNKKLLEGEGIDNVVELDWWDKEQVKDLAIHFTPVQHWSARSPFDKRMTLWGGFYLDGIKKVFFAGDTGYGKVFKLINQKHGAMDVGLIPIGAYKPRHFMKYAHLNPSDAVQVFKDLQLKFAMGIHFATFEGLTDEAKDLPEKDLLKALSTQNINKNKFIAPEFGKTYTY